MADDEDEEMGALYEEGHWIWDDSNEQLTFVSDRPPEELEQIQIPTKAPTGAVEFKDDVDLIEQLRYRRRYQRKLKPGQPDVITVQCIIFMTNQTSPNTLGLCLAVQELQWPPSVSIIRSLPCDRPPEELEQIQIPTKAPTGAVEFKDDVDLIEQLRYRRRYQRKLKPGQPDVITVQDVKDIAIYTAPLTLLSPVLINMLHLPTTERFIKALIFCMQYYLQVSDEMAQRMLDLETRVRTPLCDVVEQEFATNLNDLRILVAKEYCTMLIGGADMKKYHHMGPSKKRRSLSDKDARQFETLLRMCVQIVWLALGRRAFNQLELEINRLFKTEIFNAVEHMLKTNYIGRMSREEKRVLLGPCVKNDKKLNTGSPLMNEVTCDRQIDFQMLGIGVIKLHNITPRMSFMYAVIAATEERLLAEMGVSLGIVGLQRSAFDTMLKPIPTASATSATKKAGFSMTSMKDSTSRQSTIRSTSKASCHKLYPDITIPTKCANDGYFPPAFPCETEPPRLCSDTQRRRWLNRLNRLLHPQLGKRQ